MLIPNHCCNSGNEREETEAPEVNQPDEIDESLDPNSSDEDEPKAKKKRKDSLTEVSDDNLVVPLLQKSEAKSQDQDPNNQVNSKSFLNCYSRLM